MRALPWPGGRVRTRVAGEAGVLRMLRRHLRAERGVAWGDACISG